MKENWGWTHDRIIRDLRHEVDTLESQLWPSLDARLSKVEQEVQTLGMHCHWVVSVLTTIAPGEPCYPSPEAWLAAQRPCDTAAPKGPSDAGPGQAAGPEEADETKKLAPPDPWGNYRPAGRHPAWEPLRGAQATQGAEGGESTGAPGAAEHTALETQAANAGASLALSTTTIGASEHKTLAASGDASDAPEPSVAGSPVKMFFFSTLGSIRRRHSWARGLCFRRGAPEPRESPGMTSTQDMSRPRCLTRRWWHELHQLFATSAATTHAPTVPAAARRSREILSQRALLSLS